MITLTGLDSWEIVALSGLLAGGFMSFASVIGVTVAYFATREPRGARHAATAPAVAHQTSNATEPAVGTRPASATLAH